MRRVVINPHPKPKIGDHFRRKTLKVGRRVCFQSFGQKRANPPTPWRFLWSRGGPVGTLDCTLQAITFDLLGSVHVDRWFSNLEDAVLNSKEGIWGIRRKQTCSKYNPQHPTELVFAHPSPSPRKTLPGGRYSVLQGLHLCEEKFSQ